MGFDGISLVIHSDIKIRKSWGYQWYIYKKNNWVKTKVPDWYPETAEQKLGTWWIFIPPHKNGQLTHPLCGFSSKDSLFFFFFRSFGKLTQRSRWGLFQGDNLGIFRQQLLDISWFQVEGQDTTNHWKPWSCHPNMACFFQSDMVHPRS